MSTAINFSYSMPMWIPKFLQSMASSVKHDHALLICIWIQALFKHHRRNSSRSIFFVAVLSRFKHSTTGFVSSSTLIFPLRLNTRICLQYTRSSFHRRYYGSSSSHQNTLDNESDRHSHALLLSHHP